MPTNVKPMLATLVSKAFDKAGWLFEVKWDGYRAIAEVERGNVKLYSRNGLDFATKFPVIAESLAKLQCSAVLDGEIVVLDAKGRPDFQLLQDYQSSRKTSLVFVVFDLLYLNGHDLQNAPLRERKEILQKILVSLPYISYCEHIETSGQSFFNAAKAQGLEGIIAKDGDSPYQQNVRGMSWQKIKTHLRQEAIICGFTKPRGSRTNFGSLILGVYSEGKFKYIGNAGTGFDEKSLVVLYEKMKELITDKPPFDPPIGIEAATWIKPKLICEVQFAEWTKEGLMRQPIFKGLRVDKSPTEVILETPASSSVFATKSPAEERNDGQFVNIKGTKVELTHLDKVFWPKEGVTKGELIEYYRQISDHILPHLKDRPESLLRYPDGIEGKSFFHKDVGNLVPEWLKTVKINLESEGRSIEYCLCQDEASLTFLINLGCIDLNPWNSRVGSEEFPDYAILDLDPESTPFANVVKTARQVKEVLDLGKIKAFCKTSGARGIHIYIPLNAKYSYEQARTFCIVIASLVNQRIPEITSLNRSPSDRQGKVYLDCFQNARGQTLASVYSVRPKSGATVSTPLHWDELDEKLLPTQFTLKNIVGRIEKYGDLFKGVLSDGIDMETSLKLLQ